ncbi:hypothetical protein QTG54_006281 [Skeletonema marinoi]|uniref:Uncharacterized protein n=1 Tax=Skeletonema marinoi TaxID=267567 RepID=A0AAD8YBU9_9STRA|nr:hypothetical protein QTG54_006281 [Skeletonema marinoi]
MNFTNCNLCHPKLTASPSYGDAIRYHAESESHENGVGINCYGDEFKEYLSDGTLRVDVDWGTNHSELYQQLVDACFSGVNGDTTSTLTVLAQITVHGIGRRPAMALLASNSIQIDASLQNDNSTKIFPPFDVKWRHDININDETLQLYPEYLVRLKITHHGSINHDHGITRHLHVAPPPIGRLGFRLSDVIWSPGLFQGDQAHSNEIADSVLLRRTADENKDADDSVVEIRRRGFGLELETVQLPPDAENDCFTHQQQYVQSVARARKWHLNRVSDDEDDGIKRANELYDELLLWNVSHDLYVENAAPPTRHDLYQQIMAHIKSNQCDPELSNDAEAIRTLNELVLGGRVEMPAALLDDVPEQKIPTSQASPEYKSPLPPNELYHTFPPPKDGHDDASDSIRLVLDGVLKNAAASSRGVAVPTVSDIGQSGTSIHVHVNITNPTAWPRKAVTQCGDIEATSSLLSVIFGWICFDRVIGCHFNMPNVWRDRSFAPMYVTGPEFSWNEVSWRHGSSTLKPEQVKHVKLNNLQAWFEHVHSCLKSTRGEEKKEQDPTSLFELVFDNEVLINTISRWNSLNLLSLKQYGTIEFRRMHATLDPDFVSAWTWFCVGFVEKFSQASMFDRYLHPFVGGATSMEVGLGRLLNAQNNATIEDLYEIMCNEDDPSMPPSAFDKLICNRC